MNHALIGHDEPVDRIAARLFWRAPWWAKCPEQTKREVAVAIAPDPEKRVVDYFKESPTGSSGEFGPLNRKGQMVFWPEGNSWIGAKPNKKYLVTGFADKTGNGSAWWILIEGQFVRLSSRKFPNRRERF